LLHSRDIARFDKSDETKEDSGRSIALNVARVIAGGAVSLKTIRKWSAGVLFGALALSSAVLVLQPGSAFAQEVLLRKVKTRIPPDYPELAKRMSLAGTVKLEVVVASNGSLKNAKVLGGHPVLATAALDAIKRWKFEPANAESTGTIEFRFAPNGQ
jgi:TonB family protein